MKTWPEKVTQRVEWERPLPRGGPVLQVKKKYRILNFSYVRRSDESSDEVANAALECGETFLTVSGIFLKPTTHKVS